MRFSFGFNGFYDFLVVFSVVSYFLGIDVFDFIIIIFFVEFIGCKWCVIFCIINKYYNRIYFIEFILF